MQSRTRKINSPRRAARRYANRFTIAASAACAALAACGAANIAFGISATAVSTALPSKQVFKATDLGNVSHHKVKRSLTNELLTLGIGDKQIKKIISAGNRVAAIGNVPVGTPYKIEWNDSFKTEPSHITVNRSTKKKLVISKNPKTKNWSAYNVDSVVTKNLKLFTGKVTSNLHDSTRRVGVPYDVYAKFIKAFRTRIDFNREQRKGDTWQVLVEQLYSDGEFAGYGQIEYGEYKSGRRKYVGVSYAHPKDNKKRLFSPQGTSLQSMFIRSPVKVSTITSTFRTKRFHPIYKVYRPHLGVDYAAKRGAPILAVGDGVIDYIGRGKASGKWIRIRHTKTYQTAYMHMHNFRKGLKLGSKVKQGQIIGYVGSTGSATGPHLHFAFYENGKFKDPLGKSFPASLRLSGGIFSRFSRHVAATAAKVEKLRAAKQRELVY